MILKGRVTMLIFAMLFLTGLLNSAVLNAADFTAPEVRLSVDQDTPEAGVPIPFSAWVTDNQGVSRVVLRYRMLGSSETFSSLTMRPGDAAKLYSTSIPTTDFSSPGVEYFVEATDVTGNISQEPFPSHPRVVMINEESSTEPPKVTSRKTKWLWGTF